MVVDSPAVRAVFAVMGRNLSPYGFVPDGMAMRVRSDVGDYVIVELQKSGGARPDPAPRVFVNTAAVAAPWWDWLRTRYPDLKEQCKHPRSEHAMWFRRLHHATSNAFLDATWAPADDTEEAGTALGRGIASHLRHEVPLLLSLLDRNALTAKFADYSPRSTLPYRAAMLAAEGPSAELNGLLAEFEPLTRWSAPFVAWVRNYAAGHGTA